MSAMSPRRRYRRKLTGWPAGQGHSYIWRNIPAGPSPRGHRPATPPAAPSRGVKLVIGIVRPERANDVLAALNHAEVRGLSMSRVQGHGGKLERVETYRGTTVMMS